MRFVLASASPARLATLQAAGVRPEVIVSGFDESSIRASTTTALVAALAGVKAQTVAAQMGDALVLGCDSLLEFEGRGLGKPGSVADAVERWQRMRGKQGVLVTGHCLIDVASGRRREAVARTSVHFADVSDAEIEAYCRTGEPIGVAGAFTIDGLGGWFVEAVDGDHHNVVGLSLPLLRRMLAELGYGLGDIGYPSA
ncbi:MAG: Maf-like protein [Actinomycetota bacterium]|nr:Maf-like protein [Actinomycetota bacterium]